ncbi:MAG TPA: pyridoxamine 5'-phosphate oxidase family protein [Blastocatellia bacterium]|nr:pyridoxamine 5'-phosphate oxidase family protein [Blastocatellia bacterium]
MFIHEMSEFECRQALQQATVGRLACARDNQPYVVPIYFAFDGQHVYAFTTLGQKIECMRTNARVCLEIDERTAPDQWKSIIVFGRYEELPDLPKYEAARVKAHELLQKHAMWWEPAYLGAAHRDIPHSDTPIFYRLKMDRMTGHRATPDLAELAASDGEEAKARDGWWAEILRHMGVKN